MSSLSSRGAHVGLRVLNSHRQLSPSAILDFTRHCLLITPPYHKDEGEGDGYCFLPPYSTTNYSGPPREGRPPHSHPQPGRLRPPGRAYPQPRGRHRSPASPRPHPTPPRPVPLTEERREEDSRRPASPLTPLTQAHEEHRLHLPRRHLCSGPAKQPPQQRGP